MKSVVPFELTSSGPPLSVEDLRALETKLGCPLPSSYAAFLLAHNGGQPPGSSGVDVPGLAGGETDVQEFFGLGFDDLGRNITWFLEQFPSSFARGLLPIATDSFGYLFCLYVSGEFSGRVVYLDEPPIWEDRDSKEYEIAGSFEEFLRVIQVPQDDEAPRDVEWVSAETWRSADASERTRLALTLLDAWVSGFDADRTFSGVLRCADTVIARFNELGWDVRLLDEDSESMLVYGAFFDREHESLIIRITVDETEGVFSSLSGFGDTLVRRHCDARGLSVT